MRVSQCTPTLICFALLHVCNDINHSDLISTEAEETNIEKSLEEKVQIFGIIFLYFNQTRIFLTLLLISCELRSWLIGRAHNSLST